MKTILKSAFLLPVACLLFSFVACTSSPSAKESAPEKKAELVIVAHLTTTHENQADIEKAVQDVVTGTRQEEGNVSYNFYQHTDNPLEYTFVEEWVSQDAINSHNNSDHFKAFIVAIEGKADIKVFTMKKKY